MSEPTKFAIVAVPGLSLSQSAPATLELDPGLSLQREELLPSHTSKPPEY